jgi:hypothetical protein
MNHIPSFEEFLNESSHYKIDDFQVGDVIHFKDGEAWKVVKVNNIRDLISVFPHNKLAKDKNVSITIELRLKYLNDNVTKIEKS